MDKKQEREGFLPNDPHLVKTKKSQTMKDRVDQEKDLPHVQSDRLTDPDTVK